MRGIVKGYMLGAVAAISYGLNPAFTLPLYADGMNPEKVAINIIGSTPTAILGALEPVTAVIVGIFFFGEGMTLREGIGIILILIAVTVVVGRK